MVCATNVCTGMYVYELFEQLHKFQHEVMYACSVLLRACFVIMITSHCQSRCSLFLMHQVHSYYVVCCRAVAVNFESDTFVEQ